MRSTKLAFIITCAILVIAYAISVAHDSKEVVGIICMFGLGYILCNGLYYSIYELIKLIRDE